MKKFLLICCPAVMLVAGACATSPDSYHYETENELKPGSGLFSGEDGSVTLYEKGGTAPEEEPESE